MNIISSQAYSYLDKCILAVSALEVVLAAVKGGVMLVADHTAGVGADILRTVPPAVSALTERGREGRDQHT